MFRTSMARSWMLLPPWTEGWNLRSRSSKGTKDGLLGKAGGQKMGPTTLIPDSRKALWVHLPILVGHCLHRLLRHRPSTGLSLIQVVVVISKRLCPLCLLCMPIKVHKTIMADHPTRLMHSCLTMRLVIDRFWAEEEEALMLVHLPGDKSHWLPNFQTLRLESRLLNREEVMAMGNHREPERRAASLDSRDCLPEVENENKIRERLLNPPWIKEARTLRRPIVPLHLNTIITATTTATAILMTLNTSHEYDQPDQTGVKVKEAMHPIPNRIPWDVSHDHCNNPLTNEPDGHFISK